MIQILTQASMKKVYNPSNNELNILGVKIPSKDSVVVEDFLAKELQEANPRLEVVDFKEEKKEKKEEKKPIKEKSKDKTNEKNDKKSKK